MTLHVDPLVKAEVKRLAEINTSNTNDSASAEGAALLEAMVRQKIHTQQAATLETTIERLYAKANRRMAKRLAFFLTAILFDVGETKVLTTNVLGMQKGMTEEMLKDILRDADKQTKRRLSRKYPELHEFTEAIEQWLLAEEEDLSADRQDDGQGQTSRQASWQKRGGETNGHSKRGGRPV